MKSPYEYAKSSVAICGVTLGFAAEIFSRPLLKVFILPNVPSIALFSSHTLKFMVSTKTVLRGSRIDWTFGFRNISDGSYADFGVFGSVLVMADYLV